MKNDFTKRLSALLMAYPELSSDRHGAELKQRVLLKIQEQAQARLEKALMKSLRVLYQPLSGSRERILKSSLFAELAGLRPVSFWESLQVQGVLVLKKALAISFSLLLIANFLFIPFASDPNAGFFSTVRAAYITCTGTVFINGALCNPESLTELSPGDSIATDSMSEATLVYSDSSLVRLEKTTIAALDQEESDQINVAQGSVWVNTKSNAGTDAFTLSFPELKVRVPQGSAAVAMNGKVTKLLTSNSPVEVQIDRKVGVTEVMAVAPEKKLIVRQQRARSMVRTSPLDTASMAWVKGNHEKDSEYLDIVKKKFPFVLENENIAEVFDAQVAGVNLVTKKLLQAHRAVAEGSRRNAETSLRDVLSLLSDNHQYSDLTNRADLAILSEIEQESPEFHSLVKEIRGKKIEQLRLLTIKTSEEVVSDSISGMAYRPTL